MQSEWKYTPLGDILILQRGHDLPSDKREYGTIPIIGSAGITGYHSEAKMSGPGVVIGRSGNSMGSISFTDINYWPLNTGLYIKDFKGNNCKYIYYLLQTINFDQFNSGSAQKSLNRNFVYPYKVYMTTSILEQEKIAHILATLDDKIELNRKMNQTLEEMAQALFKSWFVDFDPVHAKATCKSDTELEKAATELGISKEMLELFPSEVEESEMGMIPKGWEIVKIEEILKRYRAPKRYKKDVVESYGKTMVLEQGADIILGYHNGVGEFEATVEEPMFIFGDHTCVMRLSTKSFSISENVIPLSGAIRNGYWAYYATYGQQSFQEYRRHWSELIVRQIVLAPIDICNYFAEKIKHLVLKVEQNRFENNELIMTRDTLLPKLLSGELDVSEVEI